MMTRIEVQLGKTQVELNLPDEEENNVLETCQRTMTRLERLRGLNWKTLPLFGVVLDSFRGDLVKLLQPAMNQEDAQKVFADASFEQLLFAIAAIEESRWLLSEEKEKVVVN